MPEGYTDRPKRARMSCVYSVDGTLETVPSRRSPSRRSPSKPVVKLTSARMPPAARFA